MGEATLSGVYVETDDKTGLARVRMIRVGGGCRRQVP
jgi:2',3'-cyclic-nucleotide 2'-phosphodiesterase